MAAGRIRLVRFVCVLAVSALVIPLAATAASAKPTVDSSTDGTAAPHAAGNDLANIKSDHWIVQLTDDSVATRAAKQGKAGKKLDANAPDNLAWQAHLQDSQQSFQSALTKVAKNAKVQRKYQTALNGVSVKMSTADANAVRAMPGVAAVTPDVGYHLDIAGPVEQIGAPALWNQLGGQADAGNGVKVAIIDGGIYVTRDQQGHYAGNACFNDVGFQAPAGFPKGDTRFTNNKVIVARNYIRPDDPPVAGSDTPLPGPLDDSHGTHVAGTVACDAGTVANVNGATTTLSGVAPRAYLMNYKVFYKSQSPEDFQNENGYVAELVQAIDDAVKDGADVMSNSWGSSYQNTLAWPDPMVQAAEAAVDAGVVMVFANGNNGPDEATVGSPANSPKVIGVGAVSGTTTISTGVIDVTRPPQEAGGLTNLDVGPAAFGPQPDSLGPDLFTGLENSDPQACTPPPRNTLHFKIVLIERGNCDFSTKVLNVQRAGAVGAIIYNSAANGDNLQSMGAGAGADQVRIPSYFARRSDGLRLVDLARFNRLAKLKVTALSHVAANVGDVVAGFSSRGPTTDKLIKPDVMAPGVDVISSGFANVPYPGNVLGFAAESGTSMAAPHVAGSAALLKQLHPDWTPSQVKSALMSTATEAVFLNTTQTVPAGVLDRGAGRIDLTKAGQPGLTFDRPSISAGELAAGQGTDAAVAATNVNGRPDTWDVTTAPSDPAFVIGVGSSSLAVKAGQTATLPVHLSTTARAAPQNYEGDIVLVSRATGVRAHIPVWLKVVPTIKIADVLLVDDDGSPLGAFHDYGSLYQQVFRSAGVNYRYWDADQQGFPDLNTLFGYRAVVYFTGDNNSFDTSGLALSDQDTLNEWLDSGGRLWALGPNLAEATDSNTFDSEHLGRSRLYHGYLGLREDTGEVYAGTPPRPTATGVGPMAGLNLDLSREQSIEGSSALGDTDTYSAMSTMTELFAPRGGTSPGSGIGWGRSSEPSLSETRVQFRYRSVGMGFGLEGISSGSGNGNGLASAAAVAKQTVAWLLDDVRATPTAAAPAHGNPHSVAVSANAVSSSGSPFTRFRYDFGDGSPILTSASSTVQHTYGGNPHNSYVVRIEATDALGHRVVTTKTFSAK